MYLYCTKVCNKQQFTKKSSVGVLWLWYLRIKREKRINKDDDALDLTKKNTYEL